MSHPVFTPSAADPVELDSVTVGRSELFAALVERIAVAARDGSRPHTVLVAPRGGGKTHTLRVAVHRSLADPATAEAVLPVWVPEDALAVGSYADLLVEIACAIGPALGIAARGHRLNKDVVAIERSVLAAAGGRMILLAIENVDRVFESIGQAGQGSLRAWVETSSSITIFATAPSLFSGISSRSFPWYGSFMVEHLPELTADEGALVLAQAARRRGDPDLAEFAASPEGHDRLRVIHRLAGGSPRLWHVLSDCVDVTSLDELVPAVESLLDRLTPNYQQRLWQLAAGERKLIVELARGWEPRTVGDLAAAVGVTNQSAATALGRLASSHWVTSGKAHSGDQRASWYDLTEPLLRYHVQYRDDRGKPLRLIVEFLRAFYSRDRLLAELAQAVRDSPLERYVRTALLDGAIAWCQLGGGDELDNLAGTIRLWLADDRREIVEVAFALDALLSEVLGTARHSTDSTAAQPVVATAVAAARTRQGSAQDRLLAGLVALGAGPWTPEQQDNLLLVELTWAHPEGEKLSVRLAADNAHLNRRTSELAVALRLALGSALLDDGEPDAAGVTLSALVDDLADLGDKGREAETEVAWAYWARAAAMATNVLKWPLPGAKAAGTGIVVAVETGGIGWADLPKIMSALPKNDIPEVALHITLTARAAEIELAGENSPTDYLDAGGKALIAFAEKVLASPTTKPVPDRSLHRSK
jgi:hypothetical protein